MSITLLEGFDDGGWIERTSGTRDSTDVHADYGVNGKGCRIGDTVTSTLGLPVPDMYVGFTVGMAIYFPSSSGSGIFIPLRSDQPQYLNIQFDAVSQRIGLYAQSSNLPGDMSWTPGGSLKLNKWQYLEIHFKFNTNNAGHFTVWVNGVQVHTTTTIDFSPSYAPTQFLLGNTHNLFYVDNLYITDTGGTKNTLNLGPIEAKLLLPDGNGNYSQLVGSDGNSIDNYLLVDNNAATPPATTEYVGSATEGDKDTYTLDDLADTPGIKGLIASYYAAATDSGAKYIRPVIRLSSTDYVGASLGLSTDYQFVEDTFDENPATSADWTYSEINGMELGQEVRDS